MTRLAIAATTLLFLGCSGDSLPEDLIQDPVADGESWCGTPGEELHVHDQDSGQVDKSGTMVSLQGWALRSSIKMRCFDSEGEIVPCQAGKEPCSMNGSLCLSDYHISGLREAKNNILDRCGSVFADWSACAVPAGNTSTAGKTWRYKIDLSLCPNDTTLRNDFSQGVRDAFTNIDNDQLNALTFIETTAAVPPAQTITIRCATGTEIIEGFSLSAIAVGIPTGELTFESGFIADPPIQEQCADSAWGTFGAGPYPYRTDRMFSYSSALVAFDWANLWYGVTSQVWEGAMDCGLGNEPGFRRRVVQYLTLHEVGHVFGFHHYTYSTNPSNVMRAPSGTFADQCVRLGGPPLDAYQFPMDRAMSNFDYDTDGDEEGTFDFPGLSCLKLPGPAL